MTQKMVERCRVIGAEITAIGFPSRQSLKAKFKKLLHCFQN